MNERRCSYAWFICKLTLPHGLNIWDAAAGALIVQVAGGRITDTRGNPFGLATKDVFCSNGLIHRELQAYLK
ncbi:inositol monophosphatase family protein [Gordoniibacillus kamchatkensis]|uniref:inositol monophosphatase family protein n=1 Tax=Gordoniibacillus kamchatkensis TaxID=1590651 RepID=UPI0009E4EF6E|nr:inositol monophosphatase family protein [Paenibacillus sp. VKM B-2647]